jgi:hypothetical protein
MTANQDKSLNILIVRKLMKCQGKYFLKLGNLFQEIEREETILKNL